MANDIPDIGKSEVAIALKRAAQPLGLTSTAYHVLDILLGLSKSDDWQGSNRPIVAISNEKLAAYVGRSERTVIRAIKSLVEARILAYRDSSTGRRWVHRDNRGEMTFAYGLDFTPARVRYREIKRLADSWQAELNAVREARRSVTRTSRAIVDAIEAAPQAELSDFLGQMNALLDCGMEPCLKAAALKDLYELLLEAVVEPSMQTSEEDDMSQTTGEGDISVMQLSKTSSSDSLRNNRPFAKANKSTKKSNDANRVEIAPEEAQAEGPTLPSSRRHSRKGSRCIASSSLNGLDSVSISLVETACPTVQDDFGVTFKTWPELISAAHILRLGIGLSEAAYADACSRLGRELAAAILAVVAEKALRDPVKINSPGGYFRACCERADTGQLALARSLFGLARKRDTR
ncbi:MAG: plasmid replication protein RepC [Roseibium sp.]